jgi:hypothetical protein
MNNTIRLYIVFLSLLSLYNIQAQQTFVKSFKVTSDNQFEFSSELELGVESMFLGIHTGCEGSPCILISTIDYDGKLLRNKEFKSSDSGNIEFLSSRNDTLFLSGHGVWNNENRALNLYYLDKETGDSLARYLYNLDTLIGGPGIANNGHVLFNNQNLIYGEFVNKENINHGLIQWARIDGTPIRTTTYRLDGNKDINALQDLQEDGYGNLVFITVFKYQNVADEAVIRKLDRFGNVVRDLYIPSDNNLEQRPQLCVNKNRQYVFSHSIDDLPEYIGDVQQIVCTDTSGNILWLHNYPWKIIGQQPQNWSNNYKIRQITPTSDGGVIVTATIRTNRIQNRFYDDAYVGKFDSIGTLEWERRINILDDRDTLYDYCALYDIKERSDGLGYVAVGSHTPSDNLQTTNILLVSLDQDGCIERLNCDDNHLVVSTNDVIDITAHHDAPKITPNPFTDILSIESQFNDRVRIHDINGKIIVDQKTEFEITEFDTFTWNSGLYILSIISSNGKIKSFKIVKH